MTMNQVRMIWLLMQSVANGKTKEDWQTTIKVNKRNVILKIGTGANVMSCRRKRMIECASNSLRSRSPSS